VLLEIHQTLHGYKDGHELLAGSLDLHPIDQRLMLVLSDLSGDSPSRGFDSYLSCYPLRRATRYVFAKTWYAEEMERPGCVWTHSLILKFSGLARLPGLLQLLPLFQRPSAETRLADYGLPQTWAATSVREEVSPMETRAASMAGTLIYYLYGDGEHPVIVPAETSEEFQHLALRLWAQQWPRLRRASMICTGALSARTYDHRPFDLQIVPAARWRSIIRSMEANVIMPPEDPNDAPTVFGPAHAETKTESFPDWVQAASRDLTHENRRLRKFLRQHGADVPGVRSSFCSLVTAFLYVEEVRRGSRKVGDLIELLARAFPDCNDGHLLKAACLGPPSEHREALLPEFPEDSRLRTLLSTPLFPAFDPQQMDLGNRALEWLTMTSGTSRLNPHALNLDALGWVVESELNPVGKSIRKRVLDQISTQSLAFVFQESRDLFSAIVQKQPLLAARKETWAQPSEYQRCFFSLVRADLSTAGGQASVAAMLEAGSDVLAEDILTQLGRPGVHWALDWASAAFGADRSLNLGRWRSALAARPEETLSWLQEQQGRVDPQTMLLVIEGLSPGDATVHKLGCHFWLNHLRRHQEGQAALSRSTSDLGAFLLALALDCHDPDSAELAAWTFGSVHSALMDSALSWRAWRWLEPKMPESNWSFILDWDRAEKLRRAFVDKFISAKWPPRALGEALLDADTRRRLAYYAKSTHKGRALLRSSGLLEDD